MKAKYIYRRVANYIILKEAINAGNIETLRDICHQISGNAASYGFPELEEIAKQMEALSEVELTDKGIKLLRDYNIWLRTQGMFF